MDIVRYKQLNIYGKGLTQREVDIGWHFCPEWNYLLIGPKMVEWNYCHCPLKHKARFKYVARTKNAIPKSKCKRSEKRLEIQS